MIVYVYINASRNPHFFLFASLHGSMRQICKHIYIERERVAKAYIEMHVSLYA